MRLVVIDTETGGLDAQKHSILSLGAVVIKNFKILSSFHTFICEPSIVYTEGALRLNKIDLDYIKNFGKTPIEAVELFQKFLFSSFYELQQKSDQTDLFDEKLILAGHNVNFDTEFLKRLYSIARSSFDTYFSYRTIDTAALIQFLNFSGKTHCYPMNLQSCLRYFRISYDKDQMHNALEDATRTAELILKLSKLIEIRNEY